MFRNRKIEVRLVKDTPADAPIIDETPKKSFEDYVQLARKPLLTVTVGFVAVAAALTVLSAAKEITVDKFTS